MTRSMFRAACIGIAAALLFTFGCGDKSQDDQAAQDQSKSPPPRETPPREKTNTPFKTPAPGREPGPGQDEPSALPMPRVAKDRLPTYFAGGTVKLSGADLPPGVSVVLVPESGDHLPQGRVAEDGTFELSTYPPDNPAKRGQTQPPDGAPAGKYKVVLHLDPLAAISKIEAEPPAGEEGAAPPPNAVSEFGVSAPFRESLGKYSSPDTSPLVVEVTEDAANRFDLTLDASDALPAVP